MAPPRTNIPALPGATEPAWHPDGTPFSPEFGDVYYSRDNGLEETRHVFLHGNALHARWAALPPGAVFTIGETGFGTGLNFLLARQLWRAIAPPGSRLLFRSLELHPLSRDALQRALAAWPEIAAPAAQLLERWPPALGGLHTIEFDAGRVCLQLFVGDIEEALTEFADACAIPTVDAWFLDGFAPSRNPRMWSERVLAAVGALTRSGGSAATFSSAAAVRRALAAAGFGVERVPGFGRKREMIRALRGDATVVMPTLRTALTPWHLAASSAPITHRDAIVVGAGIAGSATARALALRGWRVSVLEAGPAASHGASGNPQGMLFTQLPGADSAHAEFTLASYLFALRWHRELLVHDPDGFSACGMLQLYADSEREQLEGIAARFAHLPELARPIDRDAASAIAGVPLASGGMFLPGSGWIDPRAACRAALVTPGVDLRCNARVERLSRVSDGWLIECSDGSRHAAAAVVLANARAAEALLPVPLASLQGVRGQITMLPQSLLPAAPRAVLCAEGYVSPPVAATACCGASFLRGVPVGEPSLEEHMANLQRLAAITPDFDPSRIAAEELGARVSERCATPDRLPLAGPVPDAEAFAATYAGLRDNARRLIPTSAPCLHGLMVNIGHGSRGLTSAPLAAELVAATLCAEPLPVTRRVARAVSPARFLQRRLVRGSSR